MPEESVNWIKRMLTYTVAGGKMNRGLSLMAVQQTLAVADGRTLSNKVREFERHFVHFYNFCLLRNVVNLLLWVGVLNFYRRFFWLQMM
jgi:hypothetical protein